MSNNPPITLTCPLCTQQVSDLDIRCPNCNRFLFRFTKFASSTFIVTALAALVMFRISGAIWPMYLLIGLGILHLYAVIFSKGEVLSSAATIFLGITLAWGAWLTISWLSGLEAFHGLLPTWVRMQELLHTFLVWILLGIWLLGIFWSINLGRWKSMPGIKLASSYFLGMGAFIFGLWGIWAILIQNALAQEQIFQLTTVLALLVPLVLLLGLLVRQPPVGTLTRGEVVAIWCLLFGAYLTSTDFLTTLVQFGLGKFLPKLFAVNDVFLSINLFI